MVRTDHSQIESARTLLARNLRRLRALKGWSQEELAFEANLHRTFIAHVERGARNISIDNIEKLALVFDMPVHCLLLPEIPLPEN